MKENLVNKILLLTFLMASFKSYSQARVTKNFEEEAFKFFCENKENFRMLNKAIIKFQGSSAGSYSNVYDIADCVHDIRTIKDSIPNKDFVDSLKNLYNNKNIKAPKIKINFIKCPQFKKKGYKLFPKNVFVLLLYNAILYKNNYYVELLFLNKKEQQIQIVGVRFDNNKNGIGYCNYGYTYETWKD